MNAPPEAESAADGAAATLVLGVLGGIASGKSAAARLLAGADGWVLDADRIAHEVLASEPVRSLVHERFGDAALDSRGQPDRAWLARRVFGREDARADRETLEGWIHPRVRERILERLDRARAARIPRVVLDVPLLLENDASHGFVSLCDALVFVEVAPELRAERAQRTRGWDADEVARRESHQMPLEEKRARADAVLSNEGTPEELAVAVEALLDRLQAP